MTSEAGRPSSRRPRSAVNFLASCLSLLLLGCAAHVGSVSAAKAAWSAHGAGDYTYTVVRSCFCAHRGKYHVTVSGQRVVSVVSAASGMPVPERQWVGAFGTIDDLLDLIARAERRGAHVEATYDSSDGHPKRIYVDHGYEATDQQWWFTISRLEARESGARSHPRRQSTESR